MFQCRCGARSVLVGNFCLRSTEKSAGKMDRGVGIKYTNKSWKGKFCVEMHDRRRNKPQVCLAMKCRCLLPFCYKCLFHDVFRTSGVLKCFFLDLILQLLLSLDVFVTFYKRSSSAFLNFILTANDFCRKL